MFVEFMTNDRGVRRPVKVNPEYVQCFAPFGEQARVILASGSAIEVECSYEEVAKRLEEASK